VEFENDLVRVIRFPMEPHDKTLMHTHPSTGAVIVALTDQHTRQTLADGTSREIRHKAGEAWWGAPNIAHQDENANDARAVVIRIELKQAR
jgi:quercetin dioxygenase-like cupin family protein